MKPIPVAAAKLIALDYGYDQVIIIARSVGDGPEHGEHLTTYGKDKANCDVAAKAGEFLKFKVMGWAAPVPAAPESVCPRCGKRSTDTTMFPCPDCHSTGKREEKK